MIAADQPTIFPDNVLVRVSSAEDGTMFDREKVTGATHDIKNRQAFCQSIGIHYDDVVYQYIEYGPGRTYDILTKVDATSATRNVPGILTDGLVTSVSGTGLMLPVADCVATVMYDTRKQQLYLLHLGRHSTVADFLRTALDKEVSKGARPDDFLVWMSPHAKKESYVMQYFDDAQKPEWQPFCSKQSDGYHLDLAGYNKKICTDYGIPPQNIEISNVDTVKSPDYFSHSRGDKTKRFAIVAMMQA